MNVPGKQSGKTDFVIPILTGKVSFKYPDYPGLKADLLFKDMEIAPEPERINIILGGADKGKTTLSRLLPGLIPLYTGGTFEGNVFWKGRSISEFSPRELMKVTGMVFQDPEEQLISPRCDQEIAFGLESSGIASDEICRRITDSLSWAGLSGYEERNPATLSGGEQKRLLMAVLKSQDPELWILDEIFEEIDGDFRLKLLDFLKETKKTALVFASKYHTVFDSYDPVVSIIENKKLIDPSKSEINRIMIERGFLFSTCLKGTDPGTSGNEKPSGEKKSILKLENIKYAYPGGNFNISIDSLELKEGETLAFVGANGSGKSTLGKILCGLITPDSGVLRGPGETGSELAEKQLRKSCGYLFQNPDYQLFLPTVQEELLYGYSGTMKREIAERASEASKLFSLPPDETPPSLLGYGGRRKLQGAVAYIQDRKLLILDEGDSGLDYSDFIDMVNILKSPERCLILISHQREAVRELSDRVYLFDRGGVELL